MATKKQKVENTEKPRTSGTTANNSVMKRNILVAAMTLFMVLLVIALIVNLVRLGAVNSRKKALEQQNAQLEQIIATNADMIEYCSSTEFVEEYAREWLDMTYRGEIVIGGSEEE
ncbi:MAG: hypothetical protein HDT28_08145 [Clostridiales bacterium]|nr:hypothetical protein [Clostridiales bacterium]